MHLVPAELLQPLMMILQKMRVWIFLAQFPADIPIDSVINRMGMRRFTRLTNGFSKKLENHGHMVALYFMHYNFCRVHKTLRVTPAMEAGLTDHVWDVDELVNLVSL